MRKLTMDELGRKTVEQFKGSLKMPVTVILDNVRSMNNVGSIFRTADAFLVEKIVLCGYTPQPPHRDIQKTALGATETVSWEYSASALESVNKLKELGYRVFAVEQAEKSITLDVFSTGNLDRVGLIFGNEVQGVDQGLIELCDGCVEIPQLGMKHSLNISVAAGIVLWEVFKRFKADLL